MSSRYGASTESRLLLRTSVNDDDGDVHGSEGNGLNTDFKKPHPKHTISLGVHLPRGTVGPDPFSSRAEPERFWVMTWFVYIAALQSLIWMTFSSVPDHSKAFLHVNENTLNWFLNEGPIAYCVTVPIVSKVLALPNGLTLSMRLAACLCFLGASIRCIPLAFTGEHTLTVVLIHISQSLNAAAAPWVVATVSHFSLVWFPESERNTATAVANVASALGRAIGFYLGPKIVHQASDVPTLLLIELGLAAVPLIAIFLYCPNAPKCPPSRAAALIKSNSRDDPSDSPNQVKEFKNAFSKPNFVLLVLAGGLNMGLFGCWSGLLPSVVPASWGDTTAGNFGMANTFAGIVGGILAGFATDIKCLRKELKAVIFGCLLVSGLLFAIFALSLPPLQLKMFEHLGNNRDALLTVCTLAGFFRGMTDPLYFELAAELLFPQSASTAGSILTFWYHITLVISLSMPAYIVSHYTLVAMPVTMATCLLLLMGTSVKYVRR
eukprot:m.67874 g.67874  ORF g.67874 m.67874 type:complete len:492 (+) comp23882_c0_seq2:60-1535(+)